MTVENKDFKVKNGLVVQGSSATVNGNQILTTASEIDSLSGVAISDEVTGQILYYNGSSWINKYPLEIPSQISQKTDTSYSLEITDNGKLIEFLNSSQISITVPEDEDVNFPVGSQINIIQTGVGQIVIQGDVGVTINYTPGNKLRAQWSIATLLKRSANSWLLYGDLVL